MTGWPDDFVTNRVVSLRRYPVKSMGGEELDLVEVEPRGLAGDRWYAVEDAEGRVTVARGERDWRVGDPDLDARLSAEMGAPVRVSPEAEVPHQDMGAVSLISTATLRWCAERWGGTPDPRRLRVNIVVEAEEPFVEERWTTVHVGTVELRVTERIPRCRMVDIEQDGVAPQERWLKPLTRERDMTLGVYAEVTLPGQVGRGDPVRPGPRR